MCLFYLTVGRPADRVAIEGHSYNPGYSWTLADGTPLPYTNWRPPGPQYGPYKLQLFRRDQWTEQNSYSSSRYHMFLCERR